MGARPWCLGSKIGYARLLGRGGASNHGRAVALLDDDIDLNPASTSNRHPAALGYGQT